MTQIGYTMMCEQAGPKQLVRDVTLAEEISRGAGPPGMSAVVMTMSCFLM